MRKIFAVQTKYMDALQPDGLSTVWSTVYEFTDPVDAFIARDKALDNPWGDRPWRVVEYVWSEKVLDSLDQAR